jgi:YfiH family protein
VLKLTKKGVYVWGKWAMFPRLVHGFSTRILGNMKFGFGSDEEVRKNRQKFAKILGFNPERIVEAEQIHGGQIAAVGKTDIDQEIKGADGLVTHGLKVYLFVKVADCIPILFFDPMRGVIGIAHAGWRGILAGIGANTVKFMETRFSCIPKDILVGLGPSIGSCCYLVPKKRALKFQKKFGKETVREKEGRWYLDLKKAVCNDLISAGALPSKIEVFSLCTACCPNFFFSYRREGESLSGETAAVIGLKD